MDTKSLEEHLKIVRHLMTRSVVEREEFSSFEKIKKNHVKYIQEVTKSNKEAQNILISDILAIEKELISLEKNKQGEIRKLTSYKIILESCFNAFVWIACDLQRFNIRKIFKGPKFGSILKQNIDEAISFVNGENKDPDVFAIPLDFCRFAPVCDVIKLVRKGMHSERYFVELKFGKVNEEILETIENAKTDKTKYFDFFKRRGEKGIKQMERVFRQRLNLGKNVTLLDAEPGIHDKLIVKEMKRHFSYYSDVINELFIAADNDKSATVIIDDCLILTVISTLDKHKYIQSDFTFRHRIMDKFSEKCPLCNREGADKVVNAFKEINVQEWREGFGSVVLFPLFFRQLQNEYLLDLLFGRKIIHFFFSPKQFIKLANDNGLPTSLITRKELKRDDTAGIRDFEGMFIKSSNTKEGWTWGDGLFHEIFYNWVRPLSMIKTQLELDNTGEENKEKIISF